VEPQKDLKSEKEVSPIQETFPVFMLSLEFEARNVRHPFRG
jgi:hypothetical protein